MSVINIVRTDIELPDKKQMEIVSRFLFQCFDGFSKEDRSRWRRLWKSLIAKEPGEMMVIEITQPRSGPYHRRHMAIEQAVFDAQDRFTNFDTFRQWLKFGAGWVDWIAGPAGGVIPIPRSTSYAKADEDTFRQYHAQVIEFLHGDRAAKYLWKHLEDPHAMMDKILEGFDE